MQLAIAMELSYYSSDESSPLDKNILRKKLVGILSLLVFLQLLTMIL